MMFGIVDIVIFAVCSLLSLVIGGLVVKFGGSQKSSVDYFLGGKKQHIIPVCLSLAVSYQSSIIVLGAPAEVYIYGPMVMLGCIGVFFIVPFIIRIAIPLFYRLSLTSVYQYFDKRYPSNYVRYLMVGSGITYNIVYTGIVLLGPSVVLQPLIGIPDWAIVIALSALTIIYTAIGGIKAVLWTDAFQALIMFIGILAVLITGTNVVGGSAEVLRIAADYERTQMFDFNPDPTIRHTFWTLVIGRAVRSLLMTVNQPTVQRLNSTASVKHATIATIAFIFLFVAIDIMASCCGLVAFAYYAKKRCDPLAAKLISNPNQIMISTMADIFAELPGLSGLFMSTILCASISTISSCLNALAAITSEDFIKIYKPDISDQKATIISKISVVVYGGLSTLVAVCFKFVQGSLLQLFTSVLGALSGPVIGVFMLSVFSKRTTTAGAISGGVVGFITSLWLSLGYNFSKSLPRTPWLPLGPTDGCTNVAFNKTILPEFLSNNLTTEGSRTLDTYGVVNTTVNLLVSETDPQNHAEGLDKLYSLSYMYFSTVTILVTLVIGFCVSLLKPSSHHVPPDRLVSFKESLCCCCSSSNKKKISSEGDAVDEVEENELHVHQREGEGVEDSLLGITTAMTKTTNSSHSPAL